MIGLTWRMIATRRAHAVTLFLLATVAIGAAVAAPVYLAAARRSLLEREFAAASPVEKTVIAQEVVTVAGRQGDPEGAAATERALERAFDRKAIEAVTIAGFRTVFSAEEGITIASRPDLIDFDHGAIVPIAYRDDFCGALTLTAGRCVMGPGEVIAPAGMVQRAGIVLGSTFAVQPIQVIAQGFAPPFRIADGDLGALTLVGLYEPIDPDDVYWGARSGRDMRDPDSRPLLTDRGTLSSLVHYTEFQSAIAYPLPGTFSAEHLDKIHADVTARVTTASQVIPSSKIFDLLGRVDKDFQVVGLAPGVGAALLIVLCWFVIYLAVTQTAESRRSELGMLKLRGLSAADRWWLAVAETSVPVVAGALAGYVAGHGAVWAFAAATSDGGQTAITLGPLPYAVIALAGALVASLVALRRDLLTPAVELLRRVPPRGRRWQGGVALALVAAVAVAAIVQLRTAPPGQIGGLVVFAPALGILAAGLFVAAALDPVLGWVGSRLLRRGRLGLGLAALHLSRRHSGSRLLGLMTVAVALLGFAAIATEVAAQARERQVEVGLGAPRAVLVGTVPPEHLLNAVRAVDPAGAHAMAVISEPVNGFNGPLLAVDAGRLGLALWPAGASAAADVAAKILPSPLPPPVLVRGTGLELTATFEGTPGRSSIDVGVGAEALTAYVLATAATPDGSAHIVPIGPLQPGTHTYREPVDCRAGCRLADLEVQPAVVNSDDSVRVTLHRLRQTGPARDLVSPAQFSTWRDRSAGILNVKSVAQGIQVITTGGFARRQFGISAPDHPDGVPLVTAGRRTRLSVAAADGRPIDGDPRGSVAILPRSGTDGAIVDLESLIRAEGTAPPSAYAEVWLAADAPDGIVDALRAAGLPVVGERRLVDEIRAARERPSSVGLLFFLVVAAMGVVLGVAGLAVAAGVERSARAEELRWLRLQGLRRRTVVASGLWGYLVPIVLASGFGALVAEGAWWATSGAVPTVEGVVPGFDARWWFGSGSVRAWGLACAALAVTAVWLSLVLLRATARVGRQSKAEGRRRRAAAATGGSR
jgi:putative ABC transport system permease protein